MIDGVGVYAVIPDVYVRSVPDEVCTFNVGLVVDTEAELTVVVAEVQVIPPPIAFNDVTRAELDCGVCMMYFPKYKYSLVICNVGEYL